MVNFYPYFLTQAIFLQTFYIHQESIFLPFPEEDKSNGGLYMIFFRKSKKYKAGQYNSTTGNHSNELLHSKITTNEELLKQAFKNCSDIQFRTVEVNGETEMLIVYVDGLCDTKSLDEKILKPLIVNGMTEKTNFIDTYRKLLTQHLIPITKVETVNKLSDVVEKVLMSNVALLIDGEECAIIAELKSFEKRGVEEPSSETVIRGPRDGFTETLRINTSLIRRRLRSPNLKMESFILGKESKTSVEVVYMEGIVKESVLDEVKRRISHINIDSVMGAGYIEEFIEDAPFSPFPQIQNTERPDVVCSSLLEGKIAIVVDTTPFVLIVPMTFWAGLQAAEDYYERFMYTTFIRWVRFTLLNIALFFPSFYVAITTFHPQLIPTNLIISVAAAREGIPFPAVGEALIMEFMFEALREAGIRLPKPVGSAVSIVGALVIGQAAVQAGIISAPMVIVVAATGIASFGIPRYNLGIAYRMLRFPILILAGMLGIFGIIIGAISILIHLVTLRSFGVPYLSPLAPRGNSSLKDVLIRAPRWSMNERPSFIAGKNKERMAENQKPGTERGTKEK